MFKRARRRIEKSEQERELGLTPEIKEDLGLNDTESESDTSDPRVSLSESESSGSERPSRKRKRPLDDGEGESDAGESDDIGHASEDQDEDSGSDADAKSAEGGPTVAEALNNPLFFVSDDQQACAVCPGKRLKNRHMADLHTAATHHRRRFSRFKATAARLAARFEDTPADLAANIVRVMHAVQQNPPGAAPRAPSGMSKRALKKQNLARRRERQRKKKMTAGGAKVAQLTEGKDAILEPKKQRKRRRLEAVEASHTGPNPNPSPPTSTKSARRKAVKV